MPEKIKYSDIRRFFEKIKTTPKCWEWMACKDKHGYGVFALRGTIRAHQFSYRIFHGFQSTTKLNIDHLCRNPSCVNPNHLEIVTHRENILRGNGISAKAAKQTHCIREHEYTPENILFLKNRNERVCRECQRIRDRRRIPRLRN